MNLVIICRTLQYGGGMEKTASQLANFLYDQGNFDIAIVLIGNRANKEYTVRKDISIIGLNEIRNSKGFIDKIIHNFILYHKINDYIDKKRPDIVFSFLPEYANLLKLRFPNMKTIGSVRVNPLRDLCGIRNKLLSIRLSFLADGYIFQTDGASRCFPSKTRKKSVVIQNGCEVPEFYVNVKKIHYRKKIYSSGRFVEGKRWEDLIRAFKILHDRYPEFSLVIFGDGEKRTDLRNFIQELGLNGMVLLPGNVGDISQKMLDGYMYVFTSESEGFPNALLEAIMMGLPCISYDCDFGPSEMIIDGINGKLIKVGDIGSLSKTMIHMVEYPEIAVRYSMACNDIREKNNYDIIMKKYQKFIEEVFEK